MKVFVFLADGFEEIEAIVSIDNFRALLLLLKAHVSLPAKMFRREV